jgi:hypothetical protein
MIKTKDTPEEFCHYCKICKDIGEESRRYPTKKLLAMHVNHEHYGLMTSDETNNGYVCDLCDYQCKNSKTMWDHT